MTTEPSEYMGHVLIKFKCTKNTSKLILHMHDNLELDEASFELRSLTQEFFIPVVELRRSNYLVNYWKYDNQTQFLIIEFYKEILIQNNEYSVGLGFIGKLKSDNAGFYKSSYNDNDGNKRWLLASQMEPTDARKLAFFK